MATASPTAPTNGQASPAPLGRPSIEAAVAWLAEAQPGASLWFGTGADLDDDACEEGVCEFMCDMSDTDFVSIGLLGVSPGMFRLMAERTAKPWLTPETAEIRGDVRRVANLYRDTPAEDRRDQRTLPPGKRAADRRAA